MTLAVVFRRRVQSDLTAAFDWYQLQRSGLGGEFLASAQSAFRSVQSYPAFFGFLHGAWVSGRQCISMTVERQPKRAPFQPCRVAC
jgi:hypothetical protein